MEGFRPAFYEEDPKLHSIELLAWAAVQPCFTAGDMKQAFSQELSVYQTAKGEDNSDHELSERLRKLANSGMIVAVDQARLDTTSPVAAIDEARKAAIEIRAARIKEETKGRRGRPPRIYIITNAGSKQVARRTEDLDEIAKKRQDQQNA